MRGLIRDCLPNSRVCTRVWGNFLRIANPIHGKTLDFRVGHSAYFGLAQKSKITMEFDKNCIKMEEKSMGGIRFV